MRKTSTKRYLCLLLTVVLMLMVMTPVIAEPAAENDGNLKVAIISDIHYLCPDMIKDTADFQYTMNFDRKLLPETDAILDNFLNAVRNEKPDVLLIPGDMSSNGELECHQAVAEKLQALQADLPGLKIYVTTGNHDINNYDGKNYNTADGAAVPAAFTTPEAYEDVYSFVYNDDSVIARFTPAEGSMAGGFSYAARPCEGFTFIVVDSCMYSSDVTASGENVGDVGGVIGADLEAWILQQADEAKQRGDVVMAMMHHGIVSHFSLESTLLGDFLVNDYEHIAAMFADAGVSFVFTGHMHANDIAAYTTESGNTVYDIQTGSGATYPSPMRFVSFAAADGQTSASISTRSHAGPISFVNALTGENQVIEDLTEYGRCLGYDADSVMNLASRIIRNFVYKYVCADSITVNWMLDKLDGHLDSIVRQTFAIQVDDEHTLIDAINYVYQMLMSGEDNGVYPDWVQSVLDRTASGELISEILDIVKHEAFGNLADLMRFEGIITKAIESKIGELVLQVADSFGNDKNYVDDNNTVIVVDNPEAAAPDEPETPDAPDTPDEPDTPDSPDDDADPGSSSIVEIIWGKITGAFDKIIGFFFGR